MPEFRLPDLGEGLTDAEIVTWHVAVGDEVQVDQTVVEVETAKASVEVPIPFAGTVTRLFARAGEAVAVGAPLISVGVEQPAVSDTTSDTTSDTSDSAADSSGAVLIGYGTSAERPRRARGGRPSRSATTPTPATPPAATPVPANGAPVSRTLAVVSPLVRRMARESGVDLREVDGTGPSGLIMRRDVEHAAASESRPASGGERRVPLTGARKAMADKLSRSRREIPEATVWVDVDATELLDARRAINAARPDEPVSLLALVAKFALLGLARYPELNGRIVDGALLLSSSVGLGFAAQTDRGLVVPVVPDAQALSVRALSARLASRTELARAGKAGPAELSGGTFTVNNYGVFGVDGSAAIINHPELAILGIGRIIDRPWVVDGALAVRKITQLTIAFDHRACDGGTAGGFLRFVADCVESPISALADL